MARSRTTFRPGVSGNPFGRPKVVAEIRDTARQYGADCIAQLVNMAGINGTRGASNEAVRLGAVRELLDRGFGKATQHIAGDEEAVPMAIDFRWADAMPEQIASDVLTSEHQIRRSIIVGATEDDRGEVDMVTCGNAD